MKSHPIYFWKKFIGFLRKYNNVDNYQTYFTEPIDFINDRILILQSSSIG